MQPTPNPQDPVVANFLQGLGQTAMAGGAGQPAFHELAHVNELLRLECCDVLHTSNTLSTVQDPELKQLLQTCAQSGQAHIEALVNWCSAHNVAHAGGVQ
jgi:hypothetical protein